jgi:hypothetical protein
VTEEPGHEAPNDRPSILRRWIPRRQTSFTGWLFVVITATYAFFSYHQWEAVRESNRLTLEAVNHAAAVAKSSDASTAESLRLIREGLRITRETDEVSRRAWLTVKTATLAKPLATGEAPIVLLEIINSGKGPAVDVILAGSVFSRAALPPNDIAREITRPDASRMAIGPDAMIIIPMTASEPISEQEQIDAIQYGPWRLYARGVIAYLDALRTPRKTTFCFRLKSDDFDGRVMGACERGNTVE